MKILFLADFAGALPRAIHNIGHDIRIFIPGYGCIDRTQSTPFPVYFFDDERFIKRQEVGKDFPGNQEAFGAYCRAVFPLIEKLDWMPDVVHANDWQTGPVIKGIKEIRGSRPEFSRTATIFSIHNIASQRDYGSVNFMRQGIESADAITTVSETYAREIQTNEYGSGLENLLKQRTKDLHGILNGVDYESWNPATDLHLVRKYNRRTLSLRPQNKGALQKELGLPVDPSIPLIGIVSRLDNQKGFDLVLQVIDDILCLDVQLVVLGTGDPRYQRLFTQAQKKYPAKLCLKLDFDSGLAHRIYAGADMFLMPSKYEPCGLGQLIALRYGAIPIVRKTGGLADTVKDNESGFVFEKYSEDDLFLTVKRAIASFKDQKRWVEMQERVMGEDYSWDRSAKKYIALYAKTLSRPCKNVRFSAT
ncbi:MAG: glycogen/starch synthase [bacterium]